MNQRTRLSLYMLAGLYLAYTGGKLCIEVLGGKPENLILYVLFGVFFVVGGVGLFLFAVKEYVKGDYFHQGQDEEESNETEALPLNEKTEAEETEVSEE